MEDFKLKWVLLKAYTLLKNTYIEVERRIYANHFSKGIEDYSIVTFSRDGTVAVVALTKDKKVILLRQYRPAADRRIINLPGGRIDQGKTAEKAVREELENETGYSAETFKRIYETHQNPTRVTDKSIIFFAKNAYKKQEPKQEPTEKGADLLLEDFDNIIKFLTEGKLNQNTRLKNEDIFDITTVAAILLAKERGLLK